MSIVLSNATEILTMKRGLGVVKNRSILIEDGIIEKIGTVRPKKHYRIIDATGCVVCPGFVDSHTHLVFGGSREDEFAMRIKGLKYEAIARAGGGIASTVKHTTKASEDLLYQLGRQRLKRILRHGTTTVEIKSGYGLTSEVEYKMLRVINRLKKRAPIEVVPTFLVHTVPAKVKRDDFIKSVVDEMIPYVAKNKLAAFCDVFCDRIAFSKEESEVILSAARDWGFKLKIHTDEFANIGGALVAAKLGCTSADHLLVSTKRDIVAMKKSGVVPTLLPGTSVFLRLNGKPDMQAFRSARSDVAIASDFNPGSCMIYSMLKIIALACLAYGMHVEEALIGATKNGARALGIFDRVGSIEEGKQADLVVLNVDNYRKIPYQFGEDMVSYTIKEGKVIYGKNN
ncbi:MAG: imidazolonepropionase [candidate division WOR-3 bacterium]|nr:imidazolonepropionase [candidate division WOR-3 bacterium]